MSDKLQTAVNRGQRAAALLNDDLLKEAFAKLEAEYTAAWKASPPRDTEGRERVWQALQLVGKVRDHLGRVAADGRLAQAEITRLAEIDQAKAKRR